MGAGYLLTTSDEMRRGSQPNHSCRTLSVAVNATHSSPLQKTTLFIDDGGSSCGGAHFHTLSLGNLAVHRRLFDDSHSWWLGRVLRRHSQPV